MWFGVSLLYRAVHRKPEGLDPLWEESIVLLQADSAADAEQAAARIGRESEVEYAVADGDVLRWTFDSVLDVYEITEPNPGTGVEVFSRFLKQSEVESLRTRFER